MESTISDSRDARIRALAYELWERAGRPDGQDLEYWLEAERRLGQDGGDSADASQQPAFRSRQAQG